MNRERITEGMVEYSDYLDITDDHVKEVIIEELKRLKPGESQSYPLKNGFTQGDSGKIGYKSNLGRPDNERVTLDIVDGEAEGTSILFATCCLMEALEVKE